MPSEEWWAGFSFATLIWSLFVVAVFVIGAAMHSEHPKDGNEKSARKSLEGE